MADTIYEQFQDLWPETPSSDEAAVKDGFYSLLRKGSTKDFRSYVQMNLEDLRFLAQTDSQLGKDLEDALRFMSTGSPGPESVTEDVDLAWSTPSASDRDYNDPNQSRALETLESMAMRQMNYPTDSGFFPRRSSYTRGMPMTAEQEAAQIQGALPDASLRNVRLPEFAHGGYVGRGTMAGELGRRGDLSVREAGETMYERNKRLHGYGHGGYVHGRGTMPGELHPKGSLSVRVAGESMGEYDKHREDEDDYRPVRRTLSTALSPTLSRRMFG